MTAEERFSALSAIPLKRVGNRSRGPGGFIDTIREIAAHREMLALLVRRDLKARYKDSALGLVWALVRPLTQLAIYYIVIGKFLGAERGIPDFAIYVFTGLTAYGLFSEIVAGGTSSIVGNAGLIKKIYLPREVFPLASVGSALFNFCIQLLILLAATIALGHPPLTAELIYALPSLAVLLIWGTAFALLLSAANVYLRDIQYLVEVVLLLLLWASPIVYSWDMAKSFLGGTFLLDVYTNNPVTLAVLGFQRAFWTSGHADTPYPTELLLRLGVAALIGLVFVVVFQRVFSRLQGNFAQAL
ncbi:ABC-2 type transport system permease protein [Labedella gwakjiensis]|uniref:Transport permease protein n=1 Tax=Labedella gwakjiensis TaxID=390269 RepID=A0A2P8GXU9_9MICO|nr:ABC transporter permease [Labedella gwakjiensis]PSL38788.1 ABC-2 type transport system permease protein [Labedella gwakjiensis]RUQ87909.1 ABC transporter permease [Labedella gwakjiensis]